MPHRFLVIISLLPIPIPLIWNAIVHKNALILWSSAILSGNACCILLKVCLKIRAIDLVALLLPSIQAVAFITSWYLLTLVSVDTCIYAPALG